MSKRFNEKRAALALKAIDRELDGGYGKEDFESNAAKDARGAAMGEGEDELFEKKLSKAEKKAAAKAAREAKRKAKGKEKKPKQTEEKDDEPKKMSPEQALAKVEAILSDPNSTKDEKHEAALEKLSLEEIVVTYESRKTKMHANARNINVSGVTVTFHGKPLVEETQLVINYGNRYGFIGPNGSGKVCFIFALESKLRRTDTNCRHRFHLVLGRRKIEPNDVVERHLIHFNCAFLSFSFTEYCHEGDCCTGDSHSRKLGHLLFEFRVSRPGRHYGPRGRHGIQ